MADSVDIAGGIAVSPSGGNASGQATISISIDESLTLDGKAYNTYVLSSDSALVVPLGTLTNVHVVMIRASAKVRVRLTSADGSQQAVPVDPLGLVVSQSVPFTALDLTRVTAQETTVQVFIGQQAS